MNKNNEDMSRKRGAKSSLEQPSKRQRIVNLDAFVPNNRDLIGELTQLGTNLSLVADASRIPENEISANFLAIQQELNDALQIAFNDAQQQRRQIEQQRVETEMEGMRGEELNQFQLLQQNFLQRFQPLAQKMFEQLTYGEQAQMFNIILNSIDTRLNENNFNQSEPNNAALLVNLASITYNFALEQLAVTISNIYQASPEIIRQLTSLITASSMVYNYLPNELRSNFVSIPYLGPIFSLMNRINSPMRNIQNSAAVVTTIYYLLRNAGIDTSNSITLLGQSARELATSCAMETGKFICRGAGLASQAAISIVDGLADRLGDILTSEYKDFRLIESQESQESITSMRSIKSRISVDTNQSQDSEKSMATVLSITQLLDTPVEEGGISLGVMDGQIVENRLQAIANENSAIIPDNLEEFSLEINTQPSSIKYSSSSQESIISNLSDESEVHWSFWLFGPYNSGGKKLRKSRRRIFKRKSMKKIRKARKLTKKERRGHKTFKRKNIRRK
jgi:hypothetical protein